jgi:hypothetical protein
VSPHTCYLYLCAIQAGLGWGHLWARSNLSISSLKHRMDNSISSKPEACFARTNALCFPLTQRYSTAHQQHDPHQCACAGFLARLILQMTVTSSRRYTHDYKALPAIVRCAGVPMRRQQSRGQCFKRRKSPSRGSCQRSMSRRRARAADSAGVVVRRSALPRSTFPG